MVGSRPEELVVKLYEEGMGDKEIKQQLEDFGLSGKEIHDLMKKASRIKKDVGEKGGGEEWIEDAKEKAQKLPKPEKADRGGKSWLSGFFKKDESKPEKRQERRGTDWDQRRMKLEKLREAISTEPGGGENVETGEAEEKPKEEVLVGGITEIIEERVGSTEDKEDVDTLELQSKMDQDALDKLSERIENLERELGGIKQLLEVIRDLNIKMIELSKRG
jgi:hypothetical protein